MKQTRSFVGMDVHKATISISVAEDGRSGSVRFIGVIPNTPEGGSQDGEAAPQAWWARLLL